MNQRAELPVVTTQRVATSITVVLRRHKSAKRMKEKNEQKTKQMCEIHTIWCKVLLDRD